MSADFEREVTDQLSHLRSDVDQVAWLDEAAVRRHGTRRQMQRAATTGLAVVAGVGVIGYSAILGVPGDPITLANPFLAASPSDRTETPQPTAGTTRSAPGRILSPDPSRPFEPTQPMPGRSPQSPARTTPEPSGADPEPTSSSSSSPVDSPSPGSTTDAPTADPTLPELSAGTVLAASEMPQVNDSEFTWSGGDATSGEGSPASVCQSAGLAGLGATEAMRRDFTWGPDGTVTGTNVVAVFSSAAEASSAYDAYTGWLSGCSWGTPHGPTDVGVEAGAASWWWVGHDNGDETGETEVVGLARNGAALSVVVWHQDGQDLIYESDPMAPPLRAASARLAPYTLD